MQSVLGSSLQPARVSQKSDAQSVLGPLHRRSVSPQLPVLRSIGTPRLVYRMLFLLWMGHWNATCAASSLDQLERNMCGMNQNCYDVVSMGRCKLWRGMTHWLGLSRSPPRLDWSWQQQRIYLIKPSRLYKLPVEVVLVILRDAMLVSKDVGPSTQASMSGQQPPTQWL